MEDVERRGWYSVGVIEAQDEDGGRALGKSDGEGISVRLVATADYGSGGMA